MATAIATTASEETTGSSHDDVAPPEFNEEWPTPRDRERRTGRGRGSVGTGEFPDVGERSIPNVSPMTAHVFSW